MNNISIDIGLSLTSLSSGVSDDVNFYVDESGNFYVDESGNFYVDG